MDVTSFVVDLGSIGLGPV